jgi:hypothetical protein
MQEIFHLMKQPLTSLKKESKVCDDKGHSLKKGIFLSDATYFRQAWQRILHFYST